MLLQRIHHVAILCADYARSKAFYTQVLGLRVLAENYQPQRASYKLDLALGDDPSAGRIELFHIPGAPPRPSRPEALGLRHLAFAVADLDAAVAQLQAAGVALEPLRVDPYTQRRFTFLADPDGLPLELYEAA